MLPTPRNKVINPSLFDNAVIDLAVFGSAFINIKYEPLNPDLVVRVNFRRDGILVRSEGVAPYAMAGDNPPGNYFTWGPQQSDGTTPWYEIEVDGLNASMEVVETQSITISFCTGCCTECATGELA